MRKRFHDATYFWFIPIVGVAAFVALLDEAGL